LALDHVSGFVLTLTDGVTDVETRVDVCGLPRLVGRRKSLRERRWKQA
jgi:hypothetical protein